MDIVNLTGTLAGTLTTASFVPQVVQTWKTRSTKDISLGMFIILGSGVSLWVVYGIYVGSLPVILANSVTLALVLVIIFLKVRYK